MLPLSIQTELNKIKQNCLVIDTETCAFYSDGRVIDLKRDFENYVLNAQIKWFGAYSFKNKKSYYLNALTQRKQIEALLRDHNVLVGFNNIDFDFPIIQNNRLVDFNKRYLQVDLMQILGTSDQKNKQGYKLKNRGELMDYDFSNNSLRHMAEVMGLETQKGEIDYSIFEKDEWSEEEINEIITYLSSDIHSEKEMFEKLWHYWLPFAELLDEQFVYDLSWIRSSIASVTYKAACRVLGVEPTYGKGQTEKENVGGNVLLPKLEEARNVWYLDFASLYPHAFCMFNLHNEIKKEDIDNYEKIWHGNDIFQVEGYYDISEWHPLAKYIAEKLEERMSLKEKDETHPMVYTLKILLNGLYGASRSPIFEKIHTPNCGADCCRISQQFQAFIIEMFDQFGFDTIYGDTDSAIIIARDEKNNNREYVQECLDQIIEILKEHVPFPVDTFKIKIEHFCDYMMWPFSDQPLIDKETIDKLNEKLIDGYELKIEDKKKIIFETTTNRVIKIGKSWVKERVGKKKNYVYIYQKKNEYKVALVGLPIIKSNATKLGKKIYTEKLEEQILLNKRAKFSEKYIKDIINEYLKNPDNLQLFAVQWKVKASNTYKKESQIQAQISRGYFNGQEGVISLIKNSKFGNAGLGEKYCTIQEAIDNKLTLDDVNFDKLMNELDPFIEYVLEAPKIKEVKKKKTSSIEKIENKSITDLIKTKDVFEIDISKYSKYKNILVPFKWPGNKKQLLPILQDVYKQSGCTKIHESFAGSAIFSLNTEVEQVTICDINEHVINLWQHIKNNNSKLINIIKSYNPEKVKDDQNYYIELRAKFNSLPQSIEKSALFHILLGCCTNGLARFNSKGEFNQTWGARCVKWSLESLESKTQKFTILLQGYENTKVDNKTLLYLDPPYLLSNDCYTAKSWNEKEEEKFLDWLSTINSKWCLSNIIKKDSRINELLQSFGKMYNVYYLNKKYNAKVGGYSDDKNKHEAQEVLITNFEVNL